MHTELSPITEKVKLKLSEILFRHSVWHDGIKDITYRHFIKVGDSYFRPFDDPLETIWKEYLRQEGGLAQLRRNLEDFNRESKIEDVHVESETDTPPDPAIKDVREKWRAYEEKAGT